MLSVRFTSLKEATGSLFLENTFDSFSLAEAVFFCAASFTVDGHCNREFYDQDSGDQSSQETFVSWKSLRPVCFHMIKGKRPPISFRIVFFLKKEQAAELFCNPVLSENADIDGFLFILSYKNQVLTATSGTSFHRFSMDRESEKLWDHLLLVWLEQHNLSCTQL